jgi:hypothetical protein
MPASEGPTEMAGQQVRLKAGVFALSSRAGTTNGTDNGTYIKAGEIVTVKAWPVDGQLLVEVEWNGLVVAMFARDLLEHAEDPGNTLPPHP